MVMARTFPPFLRPKLFHVNASSPKSKSPNGSLYCIDDIQTLMLTRPLRSLIKVALPGDEIATKNMQREVLTYRLPDVASAECFRKMYDIIDDSTLAEVKYCPNMHIYSLAKSFLRAAFTSCVVLENYEYVNTGRVPGLKDLTFF